MWRWDVVVIFLTLHYAASQNATSTENPKSRQHRKLKPAHQETDGLNPKSLLPYERALREYRESLKPKKEHLKNLAQSLDGKKDSSKNNADRRKAGGIEDSMFNFTREYKRIKEKVKRNTRILMKEKEEQFAAVKDNIFDRNKNDRKRPVKSQSTTEAPKPTVEGKKGIVCPSSTKNINGVCVQFG